MSATVTIVKGREKPIVQQHPWVFSGAIQRVQGHAQPGDIVSVQAADGKFLARGYWNSESQIQVRILTWQDEAIDDDWWRARLERSIAARAHHPNPTAQRLVNAESDWLPGLIVDRYGDWLVIQALTMGIEVRKTQLAEMLADILKPKGIYERSDVDVRGREGLERSEGLVWGEAPPDRIETDEYGLRVLVDVKNGHKTGYYLDQASNRAEIRSLLAPLALALPNDYRMINLFSFTGSFGLHALASGAGYVCNVDSYREALQQGEEIIRLNDPTWIKRTDSIMGDSFGILRDYAGSGEQFDLVVLDPPKFAHSAGQVEKAARGYKDLNLHAFKIIRPGGYLMTFSCSGAISADLFQKIVFGALADSGRQGQIVKHLEAAPDHPVALTFPEGAYLKGLLVRVY
ncbi:MAG: class I SAM-dependent rRNA methyltransferase [Chloroflexota bacterium]|nr:class I SAM-dependent rRNA methyltransferase [Chloroflexota bacterium]